MRQIESVLNISTKIAGLSAICAYIHYMQLEVYMPRSTWHLQRRILCCHALVL